MALSFLFFVCVLLSSANAQVTIDGQLLWTTLPIDFPVNSTSGNVVVLPSPVTTLNLSLANGSMATSTFDTTIAVSSTLSSDVPFSSFVVYLRNQSVFSLPDWRALSPSGANITFRDQMSVVVLGFADFSFSYARFYWQPGLLMTLNDDSVVYSEHAPTSLAWNDVDSNIAQFILRLEMTDGFLPQPSYTTTSVSIFNCTQASGDPIDVSVCAGSYPAAQISSISLSDISDSTVDETAHLGALFLRVRAASTNVYIHSEESSQRAIATLSRTIDVLSYMLIQMTFGTDVISVPIHWTPFDSGEGVNIRVGYARNATAPVATSDVTLVVALMQLPHPPVFRVLNENDATPVSVVAGKGAFYNVSRPDMPVGFFTKCVNVSYCDSASRLRQNMTVNVVGTTSFVVPAGISRRGYPWGGFYPVLWHMVTPDPVLLKVELFAFGMQSVFFLNYSEAGGPSIRAFANCSGMGVKADNGTCTCTKPWLYSGANCSLPALQCRADRCSGVGNCVEDPLTGAVSCVCDSAGAESVTGCASCAEGFSPVPGRTRDGASVFYCVNCIGGRYGRYCNYTDPVAASAADGMCNTDNGVRTEINFLGRRCQCGAGWLGSDCSLNLTAASSAYCSSHGAVVDYGAGPPTPQGVPLSTDYMCSCDTGYGGVICSQTSCDPGFDIATHCTACLANFTMTMDQIFPGVFLPSCTQCADGYDNPPVCDILWNDTQAMLALRIQHCNNQGDYLHGVCVCDVGYAGTTCALNASTLCDPGQFTGLRSLLPLSNPGQTIYGCVCPPGTSDFMGYQQCVATTQVSGRSLSCNDHGVYGSAYFVRQCDCDPGWFTYYPAQATTPSIANCNMNRVSCSMRRCSGKGECVFSLNDTSGASDAWGLSCTCDEGWFGESCQFSYATCAATYCSSSGQCVVATDAATRAVNISCLCDTFFSGQHCELPLADNGLSVSVSTEEIDPFALIASVTAHDPALRVPLGVDSNFSFVFSPLGQSVSPQAINLRAAIMNVIFKYPSSSDGGPIHDSMHSHVASGGGSSSGSAGAVLRNPVVFRVSCAVGGAVSSSQIIEGVVLNGSQILCVNRTTTGNVLSGCLDDSSAWSSLASFIGCPVLQISSNSSGSTKPRSTLMVTDDDIRPWSDLRVKMSTERFRIRLINDIGTTGAIAVSSDRVYVFKDAPRSSTPSSVYSSNPCTATVFPLCSSRDTVSYIEFYSYTPGSAPGLLGSQVGTRSFGLPVYSSGIRFDSSSGVFVVGSASGYTSILKPVPGSDTSVTQASRLPINAATLDRSFQLFRTPSDPRVAFAARVNSDSTGPVQRESFRFFRVDVDAYLQNAQSSVTQPARDQKNFAVLPLANSLAHSVNASVFDGKTSRGSMVLVGDGRMAVYVGQLQGVGWVSSVCVSPVRDVFSDDYFDFCSSPNGQLDDGTGNGVGSVPATVLIDNPLLAGASFIAVSPMVSNNSSSWTLAVVRQNAVSFFVLYMLDLSSTAANAGGLGYGSRHLRTFDINSTCVSGQYAASGRFFAAACGTSVELFFVHPSGWPDRLVTHPATGASAVSFDPSSERLFVSDDVTNELIIYDTLQAAGGMPVLAPVLLAIEFDNSTNIASVKLSVNSSSMLEDNSVTLRLYDDGVVLPDDAVLISEVNLTAVYHSGATTTNVTVPGALIGRNYTAFVHHTSSGFTSGPVRLAFPGVPVFNQTTTLPPVMDSSQTLSLSSQAQIPLWAMWLIVFCAALFLFLLARYIFKAKQNV